MRITSRGRGRVPRNSQASRVSSLTSREGLDMVKLAVTEPNVPRSRPPNDRRPQRLGE
ncbi:MAG TPA: hypothetical protein VM076_00420 [Gemmatimonadaceae bacterium]|nr:hypothetical protein [Gemmatimonadaceae bacterium]